MRLCSAVAEIAVQNHDVHEILQYLHDQRVTFSEKQMEQLMLQAGWQYASETADARMHNCLKWLCANLGAPWPNFLGSHRPDMRNQPDDWTPAAVAYARSQGCTNPLYSDYYRPAAEDLL